MIAWWCRTSTRSSAIPKASPTAARPAAVSKKRRLSTSPTSPCSIRPRAAPIAPGSRCSRTARRYAISSPTAKSLTFNRRVRMMTRLQDFYRDKVTKQLMEQFGYSSVMEVPRITKITVNMGVGEAVGDKKIIDNASGDLEQIIFPEIDYDKIDALRGMDITITTTAKTDEEGRALLAAFSFPFRG